MSRLLILVTLVLAALGVADRVIPQWAGPTHESAGPLPALALPSTETAGLALPSTETAGLALPPASRVLLVRAPATSGYGWPLPGAPTVTRAFAPPPQPWLPGHRGVDLAGTGGEQVLAAGDGQVSFAGTVAGQGVVSIDHPDGLRTTYEPVTPKVHRGQHVLRGSLVATLLPGHEGCPLAACLHWGLRSGEVYLDPLTLLHRATIRLLPLDGLAAG